MSKAGGTLRLGPLPKTDTVKLTVTLSAELKATLDRYAELHAGVWGGPVDAAALVPHMLAAFMERDRGFKSLGRGSRSTAVARPAPAHPTARSSEASGD